MSPCVRCYVRPYSLLPAPVRLLYLVQKRWLLMQIWTPFFFCFKHFIFCFVFAKNGIFNKTVRRFLKSGDYSIVSPAFCSQGCLSRHLPWHCLSRGESASISRYLRVSHMMSFVQEHKDHPRSLPEAILYHAFVILWLPTCARRVFSLNCQPWVLLTIFRHLLPPLERCYHNNPVGHDNYVT